MGDIFDDIAAEVVGGPGASSGGGDIFDEIARSVTQSQGTTLDAVSGQIGKGVGFGWFDEASGVESGMRNAIAQMFGGGNKKSFSENYRQTVDAARQQDAAFEAAHPYASTGLQLAGALVPAIATGPITAGAKMAPGIGTGAIKTLFGVGIEGAPSVPRLIGMGAAGGALAGAGQATEGNRLMGGALGAGAGAVAAPVVGKALETGLNVAGDLAADYQLIGSKAAQRGSFSTKPINGSGGYTPAELLLAQQLKNTPLDKVVAGSAEIGQTSGKDIPLFLPEALNSPKVDRNARFIANYGPSMEFSQSAISDRTADAAARATALFDTISPERSTFEGAQALVGAADEILTAAEQRRASIASPLYEEAYAQNPRIISSDLNSLIDKDAHLQQAIASVRKSAANADLPDNDIRLLIKARQELGNLIEGAKTQGRGRKARDLTDTYNQLNDILHSENPLLKDADLAYSGESGGIEELTGTFLKNLQGMSPDKIQNIGQIFNLPAERIAGLRQKFANAGLLDEWNAGIRAHLQNAVEGTRDGSNFTQKIVGNSLQANKLQAALGDAYDDVAKGLSYENRMFQGKNKYHTGSSTATNLDEQRSYERGISFWKKLKNQDWMGALAHVFSSDLPEETAQDLARIYFDPRTGSGAINKIIPLLKQYGQTRAMSAVLGKGAGIDATRLGQSLGQSGQGRGLDPLGDAQSATRSTGSSGTQGPSGQGARFQNSSFGNSTDGPIATQPETSADRVFSAVFGGSEPRAPYRGISGSFSRGNPMELQAVERPAFEQKVAEIADNLGTDPQHLLAVMNFETGGSFDSAETNRAGSGATGLIQFTPSTAQDLTGAPTREAATRLMASMTPLEQLDYVEKYLSPFRGRLNSLDDVYMAVLYPKAVGEDPEYALFREGTRAYWQNRGLDIDRDGIITKAEAASRVREFV